MQVDREKHRVDQGRLQARCISGSNLQHGSHAESSAFVHASQLSLHSYTVVPRQASWADLSRLLVDLSELVAPVSVSECRQVLVACPECGAARPWPCLRRQLLLVLTHRIERLECVAAR